CRLYSSGSSREIARAVVGLGSAAYICVARGIHSNSITCTGLAAADMCRIKQRRTVSVNFVNGNTGLPVARWCKRRQEGEAGHICIARRVHRNSPDAVPRRTASEVGGIDQRGINNQWSCPVVGGNLKAELILSLENV